MLVQMRDGSDPGGSDRRLSDGVLGRDSSVRSGLSLIACLRNANDFDSSAMI
jgi:hypothetical protein